MAIVINDNDERRKDLLSSITADGAPDMQAIIDKSPPILTLAELEIIIADVQKRMETGYDTVTIDSMSVMAKTLKGFLE